MHLGAYLSFAFELLHNFTKLQHLKSYEKILMIFLKKVGRCQGASHLDFAEDMDSFVDSGLFSKILHH